MISRTVLLFLLLAVLLAGCGKRDQEVAPVLSSLIGNWQLISPAQAYPTTLIFAYDTDNPPIDITPYKASGQAAVNQYTARIFATVDGMMLINQIESTQKAGPTEAMQIEQTYLTNLGTVVRYELSNDGLLKLHYGGDKPGTLIFKK